MSGPIATALLRLSSAEVAWTGDIDPKLSEHQISIQLEIKLERMIRDEENVALDHEFAIVAAILSEAEVPERWSRNPRLFCLLNRMNRGDLLDQFFNASLTDLWLPLPTRTIRKFLKADNEAKSFMAAQTAWFNESLPIFLKGQHLALSDPDKLELEEVRLLGAGGYGEVHTVKDHPTGQMYAMKIMSRPVIHKRHVDLMNNFKREINGMRRAKHHHCVTLEASFTDTDSIRLLCSPVADMDLSVLLDSDLNDGNRTLFYERP